MKKLFCFLWLLPLAGFGQDISGDYNGHIDLKSMKLKVVVHLQENDRRLSGSIDIPDQNAKGLKLDQLKFNNNQLSFNIPEVPGNASFNGQWKPAVDSLSGNFSQSGMSFPMLLKKAGIEKAEKPQLSQFAKMQKIEAYIDSVLRKGNMAGCAVGVIKDGEVLINKGFGYRDYEKKVKCDANTLFAIGSCTKAFTAAVLASLYDEGLFDWEKPIKQYIPYFGMKDRFADEQINGIDICTHRSGLPRHDLVWYGSTLGRKELVQRIKFMEPNKPFRTTWQYNNYMFLTAGVVAEEITKDSWENQVQKRIFDPLGMKRSKIHFEDFTAAENKSIGYKEKERKLVKTDYRNIDAMGPAGSIFSTSTDMIEWMRFLLNKGKVGGQQVISEKQVDFLLSPKVTMGEVGKEFKQPAYALGWIVSQYKGKTYIEHGGNIDGFTAEVVLLPEENIGVVILSNKDGSSIPPVTAAYIVDRLLDFEEYDWFEEKIGVNRRMADAAKKAEEEKKLAESKNKSKDKNKKPVGKKGPLHELKDYVGEYYDAAYGPLTIAMENGALIARYNENKMTIRHDNYETFVGSVDGQDIKMSFFTNDAGKVEWVRMQLEMLTGPIVFNKKIPDYLRNQAYMDKILGTYDFGGEELVLVMDKNVLLGKMTDGQKFELLPSGDDLFKLKGVEGYNMEICFDDKGNCIKIISHQPNGDFEAVRKK